MTESEALSKFGLVPDASSLEEIRREIAAETAFRRADGYDENDYEDYTPVLYLFCVQLFAARQVQDCLFIWRAKQCDFDAFCMVDSEFLCGAGLEETQTFLREQNSEEARKILDFIDQYGSFHRSDWSHEGHLDIYRRYYGLL
ncbi:MAG: hypothetical protein KY445_10205 [Armatimonadetes bacterium]|nr:hypothetical protein [Armatimonadota bacterium]